MNNLMLLFKENLSKRVADELLETTVSIPGLENPRELVDMGI